MWCLGVGVMLRKPVGSGAALWWGAGEYGEWRCQSGLFSSMSCHLWNTSDHLLHSGADKLLARPCGRC